MIAEDNKRCPVALMPTGSGNKGEPEIDRPVQAETTRQKALIMSG